MFAENNFILPPPPPPFIRPFSLVFFGTASPLTAWWISVVCTVLEFIRDITATVNTQQLGISLGITAAVRQRLSLYVLCSSIKDNSVCKQRLRFIWWGVKRSHSEGYCHCAQDWNIVSGTKVCVITDNLVVGLTTRHQSYSHTTRSYIRHKYCTKQRHGKYPTQSYKNTGIFGIWYMSTLCNYACTLG